MRGWVVTSLMVALLAGCSAEETAPADAPGGPPAYDVQATENTGVIRGVVVDAAVAPVAGADVRLHTGQATQTDAGGAFGFDGLDPGPYFIRAAKAGFNETETSVDVVAGDDAPPVVKLQVVANPMTAPLVDPRHFQGRIACGLSYYALCGFAIVSDQTNDAYQAEFGVPKPPQWVSSEAVWDGTQPTGDQLNLQVGRSPAGPVGVCTKAQGPSPLLVSFGGDDIDADKCPIGYDGHGLQVRMFSWEVEGTGIDDHTGVCVPTVDWCQGPGMALQQDFEVFVHLFYNWVPPEDWRFTEHGDPRPPASI